MTRIREEEAYIQRLISQAGTESLPVSSYICDRAFGPLVQANIGITVEAEPAL